MRPGVLRPAVRALAGTPVPGAVARQPRPRPRGDPARPRGTGRRRRPARRAPGPDLAAAARLVAPLRDGDPGGVRAHRPARGRRGPPVPGDDRGPGGPARTHRGAAPDAQPAGLATAGVTATVPSGCPRRP